MVALNAERAREEAEGLVRWLRPEYQNPGRASVPASPTLNLDLEKTGSGGKKKKSGSRADARPPGKAKKTKRAWPKTLAERVKAVSDVLRAAEESLTPEEITKHFLRAKAEDVSAILETLVVMGQARKAKERGRYLG